MLIPAGEGAAGSCRADIHYHKILCRILFPQSNGTSGKPSSRARISFAESKPCQTPLGTIAKAGGALSEDGSLPSPKEALPFALLGSTKKELSGLLWRLRALRQPSHSCDVHGEALQATGHSATRAKLARRVNIIWGSFSWPIPSVQDWAVRLQQVYTLQLRMARSNSYSKTV